MTLALGLVFIGQGNAPLPDVPKNHWIYAGEALLKRSGLMVGYHPLPREYFRYPPPFTPRELAEGVAFSIDCLERTDVELTDERDRLVAAPRDAKWEESAKRFAERRHDYGDRRLDAFFARALRTYPQAFEALGRSPGDLRERTDYALQGIRSLSRPQR